MSLYLLLFSYTGSFLKGLVVTYEIQILQQDKHTQQQQQQSKRKDDFPIELKKNQSKKIEILE